MKLKVVVLLAALVQGLTPESQAGVTHPEVIATFPGIEFGDLALDAVSHRLYAPDATAVNDFSGRLRVFDTALGVELPSIKVGVAPQGIAFNPITSRLYVVNVIDQSLSVVDASTGEVIRTIPGFGFRPRHVAVNQVTNTIYVANGGNGFGSTVTVVDGLTHAKVQDIQVGAGPEGLAVNSLTNQIYTPNWASNTVSVIDGSTQIVTSTIPVGQKPQNITIDELDNRIYVSNSGSNTVSVIDGNTHTVVDTMLVGSTPRGIDFDSFSHQVYVSNEGSNNVYVFDGDSGSFDFSIPVGLRPVDVAFEADTERLYVSAAGMGFAQGGGGLFVIGNLAPIPEPDSAPMMLLGILVLTLARLRSKRRRPA